MRCWCAMSMANYLADKLVKISENLGWAAHYGAATAHRLAGVAYGKVAEIDAATPLDDDAMSTLKGIAALTRVANDSATIGLNLLAANKGTPLTPPERVKTGLGHFYGGGDS
jgi:hypothetical protein